MTDQKTETQAPKTEAPKAAAAAPTAAPQAAPAVKAAAEAPAAAVRTATVKAAPAARRKASKPVRAKAKSRKARAAKPRIVQPRAVKATAAKARRAVARTASRTIETNVKTVKEGTKIMKKEANQVADRIQAVFGDVNERAKTAIERNTRIAEEMTDLAKGNVEAMVASTKLAAKGVEKIGHEVAEYSRKSFEDASAAIKGFAEVKSPTDLFRLQGEFARTQFDSVIAESSKLSETMIKLAGDMFEPITSRYSVAAERVKNAVAL
jgi:phasin family protein